MNYLQTVILLAALMALLTGLGYLLGGRGGRVLIAFFVAVATNVVAHWNGNRLVLSTQGILEVDEHALLGLSAWRPAEPMPMPRIYLMENPQPRALKPGMARRIRPPDLGTDS